jgi:transposase
VPWAEQGSWFAKDFEEMVAYLTQTTDRTTVCKTMGMSWRAVGGIIERVVGTRLDPSRLDGLQWREFQGTEEGNAVKDSRYALLKNPWNLTCDERHKFSEVQRDNARLYRAYLLKETLAKALNYLQPKRASEALDAWLAWASRSRLAPFVKAARTIRKYKQRILAYISHRLTNGIVEGFNNKVRTVARRAYGFHTARPLIAMLFLCCGGISLDPPIPGDRDSAT